MNVRKLKSILICLLLLALGSVIWTEFFFSQRNVLAHKKDWHLYHREFLNPNIVTYPIFVSAYALHGYRLKSDHDLGYIRIMSDKTLKPSQGTIRFRISDEGFVDIIFNATKESYSGIRLGRSKLFPSGIYKADSSEKFIQFRPLELDLGSGFVIAELREGNLRINGRELNVPEIKFENGEVGVQIPPANAEVFTFRFDDQFLNFLPEGNRWPLLGRHFLILSAVVFLFGFFPYPGRKRLAVIIMGLGTIILLWDNLLGFDVRRTPDEIVEKFKVMDSWWKPQGEPTIKEKMKALKVDDSDTALFLCRHDGCSRTRLNVPLPKKTGYRILIFGGSQSKYALVRNYEESMHFQLDKELRKSMPMVETINISTPGFFRERLNAFGPKLVNVAMDTVIIESKVSEHDYPAIKRFLTECRKNKVKVILLRTPQNILNYGEVAAPVVIPALRQGLEAKLADVPENHLWLPLRNISFIKEIQNEFGFVFLDPNEIFLDEAVMKSGQLFWDKNHMTAHGQHLFAEWLATEVKKLN